MMRRLGQAFVFVLAFLILVAELQRLEVEEVSEFRSTQQASK